MITSAKVVDGERILKDTVQSPRQSRIHCLRWGALLAIALCWLPTSCRREEVWSGAVYSKSGDTLRLSAEEPFCGCLDLVNVSHQRVYIRSRVALSENDWKPVERGGEVMTPGEELKERFDWAGLGAKDVFLLDAWSADGKPLRIRDVIRMTSYGWPFEPCDLSKCEVGPLFLNTGGLHHR
jgi:hypothetical protein